MGHARCVLANCGNSKGTKTMTSNTSKARSTAIYFARRAYDLNHYNGIRVSGFRSLELNERTPNAKGFIPVFEFIHDNGFCIELRSNGSLHSAENLLA